MILAGVGYGTCMISLDRKGAAIIGNGRHYYPCPQEPRGFQNPSVIYFSVRISIFDALKLKFLLLSNAGMNLHPMKYIAHLDLLPIKCIR